MVNTFNELLGQESWMFTQLNLIKMIVYMKVIYLYIHVHT